MSCPTLLLEPCLGETFRLRVTYKDPAGQPIDLTGWTITWTITTPTDEVIYTFPNHVTVDPTLGRIDLMLTTNEVSDYDDVTTYYTLRGTDPAMNVGEGDHDILEGRIRVG